MSECPNCAAQWTQEEIDDQVCDSCGWPYLEDLEFYNNPEEPGDV